MSAAITSSWGQSGLNRKFLIDNLLVQIFNHRDDFSRLALRHASLNSSFQAALHLPGKRFKSVLTFKRFIPTHIGAIGSMKTKNDRMSAVEQKWRM